MLEYPTFDLWLVRHGESEVNATPDVLGQTSEVPLTQLGKRQAAALGKSLKDIKFNLAFSSPYVRALDTAKMVIPHKKIILVPELREYSAGDWIGSSRKEILTSEVKLAMNNHFGGFCPPEGESFNMVQRRVSAWLDEEFIFNKTLISISKKKPSKIICFSHGLTIKSLLQYIMGYDKNFAPRLEISNTGVTKLSFSPNGWTINYINDCSHLKQL